MHSKNGLALAAYAQGSTYLEIANRFGLTRSAVAGIVHRAGVTRRPRLVVLPVERTCAYIPKDKPPSFEHMCGKPGYPWCAEHRAICMVKVKL